MNMVLAFDPGSKHVGWAAFNATTKSMTECGLLRASTPSQMLESAIELGQWCGHSDGGTVVLEVPQTYVRSKQKGSQQDLVDIAAVGGMVLGGVSAWMHGAKWKVLFVRPAEWKGQVEADEVMPKRILERLTPEERAKITPCDGIPKSLLHNVVDATGLGLFVLNRMGRGGTKK